MIDSRSRRRPTGHLTAALALALAFALTVPGLALADGPGYRVGDFGDGRVMDILPPGENGLVNATDLLQFETAKTRPPNSDDQLGKYANLLYGAPSLTDAGLGSYFNDESFGVKPGEITKTEKPGPGVTIYRDKTGVPHVYGDSDEAMSFGAGYAQAEDRLFLMDVLRHYGAGDLASFLGPSCEFEQMDHDQLLLAPYTPERAQAQVDALPAAYGAQGALAKAAVENYVKGVNAYVNAALLNPSLLPADYAAALGPPQADWKPADVVAIAGLIGGIFGKGGGGEVDNAALLQYLQDKIGPEAGRKAFDDFKESNDPDAPTTTDKPFPYEATPANVDPATTALPDRGKKLTGGPTATTPGCDLTAPNPTAKRLLRSLQAMPRHMSNALVVNGDHTVEGHPTAVFGPQVSYFAPQILSVIDLHSPHYSAMGASFPGTGLVELGRGPDYAWSATSAGSDLIDQRLEQVCARPGEAKAQPEGKYYEFDGKCLPMIHEVFQETALGPKPGGIGLTTIIKHDIYRTRHGVVQGWTTARNGEPVALVNQRSTYDHDIDSVVGFLHWGQPALTHDVASWMQGAAQISFTFNWFYVDASDTGYFASGADPIRAPGVDPNLPTWGTGNAEWQGFLPAAQHVQDVNPANGYLISWNNKPAPQFSASDNQYGYGPVFRSQMLVDQLQAQFASHGGKITRAQLVQAMEGAASQDLDGLTVLPALLDYLKAHGGTQSPGVQAMLDQLRAWQTDGAHRLKAKPGDPQYQHAAAVAIMDELMPNLIRAVFDPLLAAGGTGGVGSTGGAMTDGYAILPMQFVNTPNSGGAHLGSAYDGGYEGYLQKFFDQLSDKHPAAPFSAAVTDHLCGDPDHRSDCPTAVDGALQKTYDALVKANGGSTDVGTWTASTESAGAKESMPAHDSIAFRALGIVGQPNIDWQNRPTYQQVVQFLRSRTSASPSPSPSPTATSTPTSSAPATHHKAHHKAKHKAHHKARHRAAPASSATPAPTVATRGGGSLPFTGYEVGLAFALGLAAVALGMAGRALSRRRGGPDVS